MKTFEVIVDETELIHYQNTYVVEAETEEDAKRMVMAGGVDFKDWNTVDYSSLDKEIARKYADGELPLKEVYEVRDITIPPLSDQEKLRISRELNELEFRMAELKAKLNEDSNNK